MTKNHYICKNYQDNTLADGFFRWFGRRKQAPAAREVKTEGITKVISQVRTALNTASSAVSIYEDDALTVAAYKRALDVLAGSVARLPFQFMKRKDDIFVPFESSPLNYLTNTEPQRRMSAIRWKYMMVWQAFHDGNAYIWPRVIDGEVMELVLISRNSCNYDKVNGTYYITDVINGVYGTFGEKDVIHIYFNTLDGLTGVPLWQIGNRVLSISATGDKETLERFAKGGNVRGIVSNDISAGAGVGQYGKDQIDNLAEEIERKYKIEGKSIVGVPGDAKLTPFSMTSADMQFLDSRKWGVPEISRMTGVPPVYLYDGSSSNYKEPQQTDVAFLTQTLDDILCTIECEFQRKLVGRMPGRKFLFDRKRIYSMDLNSWANFLAKMLDNGIYTLNEARHYEGQPAVEGGDAIFMTTNRAQLGSDKLSAGVNDSNNGQED